MKRLVIIALVLLPIGCASSRPDKTKTPITRGHAIIALTITPNPVVAKNVGGNAYEFPFDVVVKETGGHPVTIDRVIANVYAGGGISVAMETYDREKIKTLGFATAIPARGEIQYHFNPRKDISDEGLLSSAYGDVRVEATDDNGTRASTKTTITVRRK